MKINNTLRLLAVSAVGTCFAPAIHAADLKIGTIDMKAVFDNYTKTKEAEGKINEARNQAKKELDERLDLFNKAQEEARKINDEANKPELSEKAKAEKTKALNEKLQSLGTLQREVQEFQQTRERQLSEQSVRSRNALLEDINKVIADKVKAAGYDLVIDKSGQSLNAVGVVVFSRESFDFTNDIIAEINKVPKAPAGKK
ncbi:MAG: OmpH family outer membrane protein [Verrucomicrobia bacterium]|nr:OmpH family outer membrane protein [Verrucomicrobiota bacterium]